APALSTQLLRWLAERGSAPKNVQLTAAGGGYFASVFDEDEGGSSAISEGVSIGFDRTLDLATLKGVVEWLERIAFREGAASGLPGCQTARSDGFAAFPSFSNGALQSKNSARSHAYAEAVERYVWATWWDKHEIGHERHPDTIVPRDGLCSSLLSAAR